MLNIFFLMRTIEFFFKVQLLLHVKLIETACSNLYHALHQLFTSLTNLGGIYALNVIGNDCYSRQEEVGLGRAITMLAIPVGALQKFSFFY